MQRLAKPSPGDRRAGSIPAPSARNAQRAGLTEKQAAILSALAAVEYGDTEGDYPLGSAGIRELARELRRDARESPRPRNWVGDDPGNLTQSLKLLMVRGLVTRDEYERPVRRDPRYRWRITQPGWDALMRYDEAD